MRWLIGYLVLACVALVFVLALFNVNPKDD